MIILGTSFPQVPNGLLNWAYHLLIFNPKHQYGYLSYVPHEVLTSYSERHWLTISSLQGHIMHGISYQSIVFVTLADPNQLSHQNNEIYEYDGF